MAQGFYQMLDCVSHCSLWSPPNSAAIVQRSEELTGLVRPALGIVVFALLASSFSLLSALHFQQFKRDFMCCFSFKELLVIAEKKKAHKRIQRINRELLTLLIQMQRRVWAEVVGKVSKM